MDNNEKTHPVDPKNFLDRAIEAVAPEWAAKRYASRVAIRMARGVPSASYRGAIATRTGVAYEQSSSYRGGTTQDRRQQGNMRDRGRRAYRENVIARSLLDTETDNIIAEGFSLQMKTSDNAFNGEAEERFYQWLDGADVAGKMTAADWFRASWREPRKDGDGGIVLVMRGGYPYLQFIPGDRIINPLGQYDPLKMFDGVECDPTGRPVRFWVRDDTEMQPNYAAIPIDARDFVYLTFRDDPLAIRGSTVFGPIFEHLDQICGYIDDVTVAARLACIFGLIEKRKNPAAALSGLNTLANSQGDQQKAITLERGMLKVLGTDESVFQVQAQQPMQQTPDFIRALFRIICLRFDMPLEIGQKDLSQVNFSGGRIGLLGYYRSCRVKQDWIKSRCWNRIVFWWLSKERQRQQLGFDDAFKTAFPEDYGTFALHGREWDYTDPLTEAEADMFEISCGIKSRKQACEERGRDAEQTMLEIAAERATSQKLGIPTVLSSRTRDEPINPANMPPAVKEGPTPEESALQFKRDVVLGMMKDHPINRILYNTSDIAGLLTDTGVPIDTTVMTDGNQGLPLLPIVAEAGPLVSGAEVNDPQGNLVGGDIEVQAPVEPPPTAPGTPAKPPTPKPNP